MVEIKSLFSEWHEAREEEAKQYVKYLMSNMIAIPKSEREMYIESHYLRGITVEELQKGGASE